MYKKVELKDGSKLEVELGMSILDIAKKISEGLARNAMAGKVDGEVKDLRLMMKMAKKHIGIQLHILWHKLLKDCMEKV